MNRQVSDTSGGGGGGQGVLLEDARGLLALLG